MTKRTILSSILSLALVLAFAASGSAAIWTATTGVGTEYTKADPTWSSGAVTISSTGNVFNLDFNVIGSWDGKSDPLTRLTDTSDGKATWDWLTINVYTVDSSGTKTLYSTFTYDDIDNGGNTIPRTVGSVIHYETLLPLAGTYVFEAVGHMTMGTGIDAESWMLDAASVTPTPLPAAVWLLGGGLLGLTGFKRIRKNA